jgi:hypothetical protein
MNSNDVLSYFGAFAGLAGLVLSVYVFVFLCLWPWLIYYKLKALVKVGKDQLVELELIRGRISPPAQSPKS